MTENTELKAGQKKEYTFGDRTLVLIPLTLGKMKDAMATFSGSNAPLEMVIDYVFKLLDNKLNAGLTREWVEANINLPEAEGIIADARAINGLGDFFGKVTGTKTVEKDLPN